MSAPSPFGQWLKQRRQELDLTQDELALRVGCSLVLIQKIESGERRPSKQIAELLAEQLNVPPAERPAFVRFARVQSSRLLSQPAPWRTAYRQFTNLPAPPTPLIGREREIETLRKRFADKRVRLLTLTGPPGIGKTRLSIHVALELLDAFENGIFFVNLAPLRDCNLVIPTLAQTIGLKETRQQSLLEQVKEYLADKQLLLLLDNFEQVVSAAPLVAELMAACPWLKVLATSRVPLHVRAERQFPVPPLTLPRLQHNADDEALAQYSSIALFVDRAQAIQPDFELTPGNAAVVADICARLDGLPLAIELVAARAVQLSLADISAQLNRRLELLTEGPSDLPARHQTLRNAIGWSYELLNRQEQQLFERLSIFSGGFTLAAAEQVCVDQTGPEPPSTGRIHLDALVDQSLLLQAQDELDRPRFSMLETIREYASERLAQRGEVQTLHHRHASYFLDLAESAEPQLTGPQQARWLEDLDREQNNVRAALTWAIGQAEPEIALRLSGALSRFWQLHGHISEGLTWAHAALSVPAPPLETAPREVISARAKALLEAGWLARDAANFAQAKSFFEQSAALYEGLDKQGLANAVYALEWIEFLLGSAPPGQLLFEKSLALFRELGDKRALAMLLLNLGRLAVGQGDFARAHACFIESLKIQQERQERYGTALALGDLGELAIYQGDWSQASRYLAESHALLNELGEKQMRAWVLTKLGEVAWREGHLKQAQRLLEQSLQLAQESESKWKVAHARAFMGLVTLSTGDAARAQSLCESSLSIFEEIGDEGSIAQTTKDLARVMLAQHSYARARALYQTSLTVLARLNYRPDIAECLEGLGALHSAQGRPQTAVRLLSAADALRRRLGAPISPILLPAYTQAVAAARAQLDEERFKQLWSEGECAMANVEVGTSFQESIATLQGLAREG